MKTEKISIDLIKVIDRARKDLGDIEELAESIKELGLLQPPVVTEELVLVAGERRLAACKLLGWEQIEVRKVRFEDYLQQLKAERDENICRKGFTFSEMVELGKKIEAVEKERARQRQAHGQTAPGKTLRQNSDEAMENSGSNQEETLVENFPQALTEKGKTRDKIAEFVGFGSGKQYEKAKFIADHADPDIIQKLNEEKISINKAYQETKAMLEAAEARAEAEKRRAEELARRLQEAESAPPRVVEKVVEKPVVVEKTVLDPALQTELDAARALAEKLAKELESVKSHAELLSGQRGEMELKIKKLEQEKEIAEKRVKRLEEAVRREKEIRGQLPEAPLKAEFDKAGALTGDLLLVVEHILKNPEKVRRYVEMAATVGVIDTADEEKALASLVGKFGAVLGYAHYKLGLRLLLARVTELLTLLEIAEKGAPRLKVIKSERGEKSEEKAQAGVDG